MNPARATDPTPGAAARFRPGPHRVALLAAAFTLPLLFVGGSVTSYGVGLAVPDWPTTFGMNMFLYDFWNAPFGVRVEHAHRLYGAAVGLATVVLAAWFLAFERRRYLKVLGVVALAVVVVQGVLGGTRVTQVSTLLAAVHGCLGQAFFGLMVALCVLTGRAWNEPGPGPEPADPARLRRRSAVTLALVYAQVVAGAWFRHYRTEPALWAHALLAVGVLGHGLYLAVAASREREARALWPSARAMGVAVTLQVVLGVAALAFMLPLGGNPRTPTLWQAMTRTAHQTNGALLLAASVVLVLRAYRHLAPAPAVKAPERAPRAVEAVA
jgi:cytochrome c oxidase assembly protein subunit 15